MNTFMNEMKNDANYKYTENGGVALSSTKRKVYDMFAFGGAYRSRSDADCELLFAEAYKEDSELAVKCLFYLGDCRGGQGERRFFRVCFKWLAQKYPRVAAGLFEYIPTYRRWDDLIYSCIGTPIENCVFDMIKAQLNLDIACKTPSLLGKWMPSENASSTTTKKAGSKIRQFMGLTHKEYRQILTELRSRINIVERLMSSGRWEEIEFDKIPSKAGLIYRNAFARRDLIAKKYEEFAKSEDTKVNADTLYPYDIVAKVTESISYGYYHRNYSAHLFDTERAMLEKYWNNQKDYFGGKQSNMLCVVDTSGSMTGNYAAAPINIAISLGMYCAERAGGPFKNHYISFSSRPQLIEIRGTDFVDKVGRIYATNLCENTNLTATFDMLLNIADRPDVQEKDIPETICVISDMEIDAMSDWGRGRWNEPNRPVETEMDKVRKKWAAHGHKMPKLIYWNVQARENTILDKNESVTYVSGASPTIFTSILTGKNGWQLCLETLLSDRYKAITI